MMSRLLYITALILTVQIVPLEIKSQNPSVYEITRMKFNTDGFSEISPVIVKDGIMFCSDRRFSSIKDRTAFDGHRLYNIYLAEMNDTTGKGKIKELRSERNSLFNNGPMCFAPDNKTVYFTSEVETGKAALKKNFKNHSGIFIADLSGTDLVALRPFKYNSPQYEIGQPSISSDGRYLFFASDMPGGQGGSDLYYCENINGDWSLPLNMGPMVNSSGTDNYPYMHPSGKLYFTSKRDGGIGNLDVYFTSMDNGVWGGPVLLPEPINSPSDDFAFVAENDLQTGFFSSNRLRNDDIYRFASTIIRKATCDIQSENSYCYRFIEENAVKYDTMPFRYEWKFGDGNKAEGPVVEHCYKDPGTYIVQLDVVNLVTKEIFYNEKSDTLILAEIEQPFIIAPDTVNIGQNINLNAKKTNLPGWKIAQYYWNFGDETIALGEEVSKTYVKPGSYNIQLIITSEAEPGGVTREACISKDIYIIRQP